MKEADKIHERLNKREKQIASWFAKIHRQVDAGKIGGEPGREWLDKWAVGRGLNIACGDFPIGESLGMDLDAKKVAIDFWGFGDSIIRDQLGEDGLDHVVTNYLECFPNPLKLLQDWHSFLKPGGIVAIVCCNSSAYEAGAGPMMNKKRINCFTYDTLSRYLIRAGFEIVECEKDGTELRIAARSNV